MVKVLKMKGKLPSEYLMQDQGVSAQPAARACCICGQPNAPHERGACPEFGLRGFQYCDEHVAAGDQGFGLPGDSVSGAAVRRKKDGER